MGTMCRGRGYGNKQDALLDLGTMKARKTRNKLLSYSWSQTMTTGLLLPLLCVVFCEVQHCCTRPLDFVCNPAVRQSMNIIGVLKEAVENCNGSDHLAFTIQLPCIRIHKASWDKQSLQQKLSSVCGSLGVLLQGLRSFQGHGHPCCQSRILKDLEHNVQNHQHILRNLDLPKTSTCSQGTLGPQATSCKKQQTKSLGQTLKLYNLLLRGTLDLLLVEFSDNCTQY